MKRLGQILAASALLVPTLLAPAPATASLAHFSADDAWWFKAMHVGEVHRQYTGKGVKIAVIDASIDLSVPELRGADVRLGPSITGKRSVSVPRAGEANHGTAMTVLIAGQGNGGVTGIAPDAQVTFYQANRDPYEDSIGTPATLISRAARDGADIISISLAGGSTENDAAVEDAIDAGAVVVAGAGRAGRPSVSYPAASPGVVSVGALSSALEPWTEQPGQSENATGSLSIVAPGVEVPAGGMTPEKRGATWVPGYARTGTSPATAITAGALALVKQKYPDATGNQLVQHLIHTTGRTDGKPYYEWRRAWGFGTVGLRAMLAKDPTGWPDENPLMKGPVNAIETYPLSVYRDPDDPTSPTESTPSASPTTADSSPAAADPSTSDDSSSQVPWAVGAVALLAIVTGGVLVARRRTRSSEEA
ncbi:MAG: S8 family serine peptidase [Aeromicrobium erythreum]